MTETFDYNATHYSINDGSCAMEFSIPGVALALINEDGFYWEADPNEWRALGKIDWDDQINVLAHARIEYGAECEALTQDEMDLMATNFENQCNPYDPYEAEHNAFWNALDAGYYPIDMDPRYDDRL